MTKFKQITGNIASPKGFKADATHAELKFQKLDLGMILSEVPAAVAGVFTTNKVAAAPVILDKEVVAGGLAQAIITNSAIANAVTGEVGMNNAKKTQRLLADKFNLEPSHVAVCSTGVIGRQLPMDKIALGISKLSAENGHAAGFAQAILTTDLVEKEVAYQVELGGQTVTVAGACKGSGMIHPNMATMLAFITTDANIAQPLLQATLSEIIETTFNQITVDGDTSTNDTVLVLANGMAENAELPTLILDEIDTGVSGKVAEEMGNVMKEMAENMQLIVITHLAQVAAKGNNNYKVVKEDVSGKTQSNIIPLNQEEKLQEIAQLLSGSKITDAALKQAEELMK